MHFALSARFLFQFVLHYLLKYFQGQTLYTLLHIERTSFKTNKAIIIASQIAQVILNKHYLNVALLLDYISLF